MTRSYIGTSSLFTGRRLGTTFVLVTLITLVLASTAWAANITGYFRTIGPGQTIYGDMNGESGRHWAGTLIAEIGEQEDIGTFCTDLEHPIHYNEAFVYEGPATCQVAWLVSNYPPLLSGDAYPDSPPTPPLANRNQEMAARQAAVWYLSDGLVLNDQTPQEIRDRTQEIVDSVPAPCEVTLETPNLKITPADVADIYPDEATQVFTVTATQGGQPMAGLLVSLSVTPETGFSLSDDTVTTGPDGSATFSVSADGPGSVEIGAEAAFTLPVGMMFSPVDGEGQRLVLGEPASGSVFGGATATWVPGATILGHVFHDRNMNGTQDEGERSLESWTVTLYDHGGAELESGDTAGEAGNYLFDGPDGVGLAAGTYRVDLSEQSGYQPTTDIQASVELAIGGHGVANFGVVKLPVVQVCKYEDLNENGIHDEGEPWLSGWEMQLYEGDDNSTVISGHGATDNEGCVVLGFFDESYYEPDTPYYVGETMQDGWFNVSPITQSIDLEIDEVEIVHFGNVQPDPAISLSKSGPDHAHEGDTIHYDFTVNNEGNVKLTGAISDPKLSDLDCSFADLAPGQSHTCSGTYVVPEGADDPLDNTASVDASDTYGHSVGANGSASTDILHPTIDLTATGDAQAHEGDAVNYTITVVNVGDADLSGLAFTGASFSGCPTSLAEGETATCSATLGEITGSDPFVATLGVAGEDALGGPASDDEAVATDILHPGLEVTVTPSAHEVYAGQPVVLAHEATNTGDTSLYNVTITSDNGTPGDPSDDRTVCTIGELGDGETLACDDTVAPYEGTTYTGTAEGHDALGGSAEDQAQATIDVTGEIPDPEEEESDTDGDGIPDYLDEDDDGDGIPDQVEGDNDADGDGTPNYLDPDADGDTIPDRVEGAGDADGDGTPNFLDLDSDGDTIPDQIEGAGDADGDGTPNFLDLDSDGDGLLDGQEWSSGPDDKLAGCTADDPICFDNDADGDGTPNYLDTDSDNDGIPDGEEGTHDSDGDGIPDWLDPDPASQSDASPPTLLPIVFH